MSSPSAAPLSRLDGVPSFFVVALYSLVDLCLLPVGYSAEWRRWLPVSTFESWWFLADDHRVPWEALVPEYATVSYADFVVSQHRDMPWYRSVYLYAFATSSTRLGQLSSPEALTVLLVLVLLLRQFKQHVVMPFFHRVGYQQALQAHGADWIAQNPERLTKVGEYAFRLVFHTVLSVYGLWALARAEWWSDPSLCFRGWPKQHDVPPSLLWYYMIQGAYNLDALVSLFEISLEMQWRWPIRYTKDSNNSNNNNNSDASSRNRVWQFPVSISKSQTVRGDFYEMMAHHLVTNLLVLASWGLRFTRVGSMVFLLHVRIYIYIYICSTACCWYRAPFCVMYLLIVAAPFPSSQDISDVPVDLSKLAHFLRYKMATACCFITMMIAWFVARLILLPFVIFRATLYDAHYALRDPDLHPMTYRLLQPMFCIGLALLIALHTFWFFLFLQMLAAMVMEEKFVDYTVHKSGEEYVQYKGGKEATTRTETNGKAKVR